MRTSAPAAIPGHELSPEQAQRLAVDGLTPTRVMRPEDPQDAANGLRLCAENGAAAVVVGGGTQLRLGSPPARYDVAFSTERLNALLEHEPADLTCRVQSGMKLAELQKALREHGQRLPLEPSQPERATVGGMVAANSNGLSRARYGTVRDWVIGIAVAYPNGTVARAGGKVVKNVAGYDLMKLHTGALGTLGVIVELNFKVQTVPQEDVSVLGRFDDFSRAMQAGSVLAHRYLLPAALVVMDREAARGCGLDSSGAFPLVARLEGYRKEVEAARREFDQTIRDHGGTTDASQPATSFWERLRDWPVADDQAVTISVATSLSKLLPVLTGNRHGALLVAQPSAGVASLRVSPDHATAVLARLRDAAGDQGQVVVTSAPSAAKAGLDVWGPPPPGFPLMRALKQSLDPANVLNPGRFVGGI